jgi:hypothetical protein
VTQGAWGAQAGIVLSSSPDSLIERNLLVGNREGFNFREQGRTTPLIESDREVAVWNHDEVIRNNIIAYNQDVQVRGWFDVSDERHWPKGGGQRTDDGRRRTDDGRREARPGDIAAAYVAKDEKGQPVGLSLDQLNLHFRDNLYYAAPGQGMLHWGVAWKRNKAYATPAAFGEELGIEAGSRILPPRFADPAALDFRVPPGVMNQIRANYPKDSIPGVKLGTLPRTETDRAASKS